MIPTVDFRTTDDHPQPLLTSLYHFTNELHNAMENWDKAKFLTILCAEFEKIKAAEGRIKDERFRQITPEINKRIEKIEEHLTKNGYANYMKAINDLQDAKNMLLQLVLLYIKVEEKLND